MEVSCVIHGRALVGYLQATLAHTESHGVHVDFAGKRLSQGGLCEVGLFIFEDGHSYLYFLPAVLSDRFDQAGKAWMSIDCLIECKKTRRKFVHL